MALQNRRTLTSIISKCSQCISVRLISSIKLSSKTSATLSGYTFSLTSGQSTLTKAALNDAAHTPRAAADLSRVTDGETDRLTDTANTGTNSQHLMHSMQPVLGFQFREGKMSGRNMSYTRLMHARKILQT